MFSTYEKLIIWIQHTVPQDPPPPPQIKKKLITNLYQITSIFYMLLEDSFGVKSISKFSWGLGSIYKKCLWVLLTHVYWFRATGGYICGCGRPSNLVFSPCYAYVCSAMRSYCPEIFVHLQDPPNMKKTIFFIFWV